MTREAEPGLCVGASEFGRSQLNDLKRWLDGLNDFVRRAARRTHLARRTFGTADQAEPQTVRSECCCDLQRETLSFAGLIEDMEATAVEYEMKRTTGRRRGEKIACLEAAEERTFSHPGARQPNGKRGDIDAEDIETVFRHPN